MMHYITLHHWSSFQKKIDLIWGSLDQETN